MEANKTLNDEELDMVSGGMSSSEWQDLKEGTILYYYVKGKAEARLAYTGKNKDIGWAYEQRLECTILELFDVDHVRCDGQDYVVGQTAWFPRGDLLDYKTDFSSDYKTRQW